jgi:hypothetical protein
MAVARRKFDCTKINIGQVNEENRHDEYECIVCGSQVIPVAPNGKIIGGDNAKVTPHFKHLNADKCGQESFIHFWAKTEFIKIGDKFKVITDKENEYICNQIFFEKTIIVNDKRYTPDATILTSCGNTIHFEYNYSNRKKIKDYLDTWKELNNIIIEVNMNSILCVFSDTIPIFNALYYDGKCFNLNEEDDFYYKVIGKYKLTEYDKKILQLREIEINKLDYLWEEIQKIKHESKDYNEIGNLIRSISSEESRKIAIDILSRVKCGGSILHNYISFIKDKIDKRLKLLNLKYNGYLIKYETYVPYYIYDRIFKGIHIVFYLPNDEFLESYYTYNYNFKDEILSYTLKSKIDNVVKELSNTHNILLKILNVLQLNNKINNYKLNYKKNTDYIDAIYFEDYRSKCFVLNKEYNTLEDFKQYNLNVFNDLINDNTEFINLPYCCLNNFNIIETTDYYKINNNLNLKYKYNNFIKQDNINMSYYKIDKSFKILPRYDFVNITSELNNLIEKVEENIDNIKSDFINTDYFTTIYKKNKTIEITDNEINKKLEQLLYPISYLSNKCDSDTLNIKLNKDFTKDKLGKTRGWLIKDFIEALKKIGIKNINNIKYFGNYCKSCGHEDIENNKEWICNYCGKENIK